MQGEGAEDISFRYGFMGQLQSNPDSTVELGDIENAKHMARKLKDDKFYKLCMDTTLKRYEAYYSEDKFLENMQRIFRTLVN